MQFSSGRHGRRFPPRWGVLGAIGLGRAGGREWLPSGEPRPQARAPHRHRGRRPRRGSHGTWANARPPGALVPFFGGGLPYQNRLQKKRNGTLILTCLLEDLVY